MKLNPDKEFVKEVGKRIKANEGHCPCVIVKTPDTICPCKEKRENNHCCCGLYLEE